MKNLLCATLFGWLILLFLTTLVQAGQVTGPNGEYKESHTDLSVKVRGGAVSVERSWLNGRWYVNPAWADLKFTYDALDGSVKTIDRAGSVFEGSGEVFVFDDRFFVRKTTQQVNGETVSGWRWSNTAGDWVDYDADSRIAAYGDRHDVSVQFERNGEGLISAVRDDRDALMLRLTYTNGQVATITDRANRSRRAEVGFFRGDQVLRTGIPFLRTPGQVSHGVLSSRFIGLGGA